MDNTRMKTVALDTVLGVNDVTVVAKTSTILDSVTFTACSGDFLAIMGPSGAGKTTLLNAIAGRQHLQSGEVTLSGKPFDKQLRRRLGFVLQDDVFFSRLTLWETLYFTAMISLPDHIVHTEKMNRVDEIINMLDIRTCMNTVIGDRFLRGLSGGEKKRASIACAILMDPDILLLDEPTSGIDSSTALLLVKQLKTFGVQYNKTIVVSIHQPSSQIYYMFDTLLLLAHGQVAYFGGAHRGPLDFLAQVGIPCDPLYNPADAVLEVLKSDQSRLDVIVSAFRQKYITTIPGLGYNDQAKGSARVFSDENKSYVINRQPFGTETLKKTESTAGIINNGYSSGSNDDMYDHTGSESCRQRWPTSFITQFRMLTWRNFKQSKGRILHTFDVAQYAVMAVLSGLLFFQIPTDASVFRDKMGACFHCVTFWTFPPVMEAIMAFPVEIGVVSKERTAGAYRLSAYYFAKTVSELPLLFIMPTLFYAFVYWMAGLNGIQQFFITWPILILSVFSAQGMGLLIGASISNIKVAALTGNTAILFSLLFSGFITQAIPPWLSWMKYMSHIFYPLSAICIVVFDNMEPLPCNQTSVKEFPMCAQNGTEYVTVKDMLHEAGIVLPIYCYVSTLIIIFVVMRVCAYFVLRLKRHNLR